MHDIYIKNKDELKNIAVTRAIAPKFYKHSVLVAEEKYSFF